MPPVYRELDRNVIPRWRTLAVTVATRELDPVRRVSTPLDLPAQTFAAQEQRLSVWRQTRSAVHGGDALASSVALALEAMAEEVAQSLKGAPVSHTMAALVRATLHEPSVTLARQAPRSVVASLKDDLRRDPSDAFSWVDMARSYAELGQLTSASRAIQIGLSLAPADRFILRSASRFYIHAEEPDRAYALLRRAASLKLDPWVLAAAISTARAAGKPPPATRTAKSILESANFAPRHVSELAAALGTENMSVGGLKAARRYFRQSLLDATENSVAQAEWASRRMSGLEFVGAVIERVADSFEARASQSFARGDFDAALRYALLWLDDQPFSVRPAVAASYVAAEALGMYAEAVRICDRGLIANPRDPELLNNRAYALACLGDNRAAIASIDEIEVSRAHKESLISALATRGLIAFRSGDPDSGRQYYKEALELAAGASHETSRRRCLLHWACEEIRAGSEFMVTVAAMAEQESERDLTPGVRILRDRLQLLIGQHSDP